MMAWARRLACVPSPGSLIMNGIDQRHIPQGIRPGSRPPTGQCLCPAATPGCHACRVHDGMGLEDVPQPVVHPQIVVGRPGGAGSW